MGVDSAQIPHRAAEGPQKGIFIIGILLVVNGDASMIVVDPLLNHSHLYLPEIHLCQSIDDSRKALRVAVPDSGCLLYIKVPAADSPRKPYQ